MNKFSLSGKIAIVTGGGRGIGRSIVDALADAGADIAVVATKKGPLDEAVNAVEAKGRRAKAYSLDLRIVSEIRSLVKDVVDDFGDLHIVVNNAGVQLLGPAEELSEEYWDDTLTTNLKAPFFLAQAAAQHYISAVVVAKSSTSPRSWQRSASRCFPRIAPRRVASCS